MLHNLKHLVEALVSRVAGVILEESLDDCLAFLLAQAANDFPNEEDHCLHGASPSIGPPDLPPPR